VKVLAALALVVACSAPELVRPSDVEICKRWVAVAVERLEACGADAAALRVWIESKSGRCARLVFVNPLAPSPASCIDSIAAITCEQIRSLPTPIPWCEAFVTSE